MELEEALRRRRITQPRTPMDERLPGGQSVAELMMANPALSRPRVVAGTDPGTPPPVPAFNPSGVGPIAPTSLPMPPPSPRIGAQVPAGAGNLQRLMAERQALGEADPASRVSRRDWGYEVGPPEQSPSRFKHAGMGAGQGAIIAGQASHGDPWATLAGAVTGALTGGVSPSLIQAFQRRQELDRNAGELATEEALQLRSAQIGETEAQAEQRRLEPYLRAQQLAQQQANTQMLEEGRNTRAEAANKTRVQTASEANKLRAAQLEETRKRTAEQGRHNRVVESNAGAGPSERTVNGAIYRKDASGVWRQAPGSPPPLPSGVVVRQSEKTTERGEKGKQAQALYQKGSDYWDQAKGKRDEARQLGLGPDGQPSRIAATRNEDAIKRLLREAESLEAKTREVQIRGDMLAAESESADTATTTTTTTRSGRTIEGAIDAFRAKYNREPTAEETARMKRALGQ